MTNNETAIDMSIQGEPISENQLHVLYAIGRRNSPTRSEIASQLSKVGIAAGLRRQIIRELVNAGIVVESKDSRIGQRGAKTVRYKLSLIGESWYEHAFNNSGGGQ